MNNDLRIKILKIITKFKEGHIPSSFSIIDILDYLYGNVLKYDSKNPKSDGRDYFYLSKGHASVALFVTLNKYKLLNDEDLMDYGLLNSKLGGHPDMTKVDFVEASTGSLGHGFPTAVGTALGLKIKKKKNKVFALLGDGECHEGTIWEAANIASNNNLTNLIAIVDLNKSAQQLMPIENMTQKWRAFGWTVYQMDGHNLNSLKNTFEKIKIKKNKSPVVVIAKTIKGKGSKITEGHGIWHHKIPNSQEFELIFKDLMKSK